MTVAIVVKGYYSSAIAVLCTAVSASLKTLLTLDMVAHPFNSSTWMQRQVELCKFKGILGYILNSGPFALCLEILGMSHIFPPFLTHFDYFHPTMN